MQDLRVALGASLALLGTLAGLLGLIFAYFWLGTNHEFAHANANLLLCSPHLLALAVLGPQFALGKSARPTLAVLVVAVAAGVLGVSGVSTQRNYEIAALLLPIWLGLASAVALASRMRTTP